ncbi:hypothetical protein SUGI_1097460 [Cryptomeria japonica]|uniref:ankyrin repeat-containing protein At5g02620-like n=1 Tax=Cryptomeria japonica TaxID=3369 RepID=UPI00241482E4|nr:ankyrin repeat-containing protein At5g02620-like [Cryptomeria japonica]XP_059069176.1 ankyrin repeat-containing protein At5g02620-like [Cryptomeria japonica]XP_059069177.1 ankyrin repeat-containing protein At5g02620-like [Cryptomeria japonica]GLJ51637.1 hypothetical protein SUGI_1097460 [Cryptomeria japonica]
MERKLYDAVKLGDSEALKSFQDNGLNILQQITPTKNTALHVAAYHGHLGAVKMMVQLMDRDIEVGNQGSHGFLTARNDEGNIALHEAAIGGQRNVVQYFLQNHPDLVNIVNHAGETALFKAAEEGHKKIVEDLLSPTDSKYDKRTSDGQTLVQCAVYKSHKGVLKKLIANNPELLQQVDSLGRTPLHSAAYLNGISRIAKIILEKDRSLCYKVDNNHQSALHLAVKEGNLELATEILTYAKDCIEILDNDGRTALHLVVENAVQTFHRISRRIKTLVLLVTSKRLINKPDKLGKTALDIAIHKMSSDERLFYGIKRLLERNGARSSARAVAVEETKEHSLANEKSTWNVQIVSVNAVLIATVAFAAAFTLPKEDPHYVVVFQMTVICDALAFCTSISSAVLLMYALYGKQEDPLLLNTSLTGLWIALISLLLAFGAAIFEVVAPKHRAVAGTVLAMVSVVPICIRMMIFRSKKYIFREDEHHLWTLVIVSCVQMILLFILGTITEITAPQALGMVVGLMVVWIAASLGPKKWFLSQRRISRDNGHYIWFLVIGAIMNSLFILFLVAVFIGIN